MTALNKSSLKATTDLPPDPNTPGQSVSHKKNKQKLYIRGMGHNTTTTKKLNKIKNNSNQLNISHLTLRTLCKYQYQFV